jgi:membrane protein YdbS with pleckstrin-like domain
VQEWLGILDPASGLKQFRLVHQVNRAPTIVLLRKLMFEQMRQPMRIDDETLNAGGNQMIKRKGNEWLLKNRHQRFWQFISQRPQTRSQSGGKNKSLRNHCLVLGSRSATNWAMAEEPVWHGTSSQVKNASVFLFCGLCLCALILLFAILWRNESTRDFSPYIFTPAIVPIFIALARFLQTKNKVYELTTERLKITEGVFNKVTDTLELYRVKDLETRQPFWQRIFGVENIRINTTDASSPFVLIDAVPQKLGLADKIRNAVENVRMQKRVRELDIE